MYNYYIGTLNVQYNSIIIILIFTFITIYNISR